jgi:Tfp pilus assembly protein PilX
MLAQYAQTRAMPLRARQTGVVMVITLIVLVAMTLAAIALVRSVDTANVIAGNLAFKQATVNSADRGAEAAVAWLETAGNLLYSNNSPNGYTSNEQDNHPGIGESWDNYWNNTIALANPSIVVCAPTNCNPDAAGNVVSYTIHRLCLQAGAPGGAGQFCGKSPTSYILDSSQGGGTVNLNTANQYYYRITIRIAGPRNTVSYVQTVVALST